MASVAIESQCECAEPSAQDYSRLDWANFLLYWVIGL
jgi:hypothetical protein